MDQAEVDRIKQPEPEEEEDKSRLIFWMIRSACTSGKWARFPCSPATRKWRFPSASKMLKTKLRTLSTAFGFAAKEHIALAEKLVSEPPKERFDRVILGIRKSTAATRTSGNCAR